MASPRCWPCDRATSILDEPTAQLDPAGTRLVGEALRALADGGTTLLIAEHKTDLLDGLCSRIVVLDAGRIVMDGPTAAVFDDPRLHELGVEPPARARLGRALIERGVEPATVGRRPRRRESAHDGRAVLETVGLVHVYPGGTRALDGVDLVIRRGERVAIVGQNGSGKSTLVRHFNGLLRPTEGRVLVDGVDAAGQASRRTGRIGGPGLPGPRPPDLRGPRPGARSRSVRATWGCAAPSSTVRSTTPWPRSAWTVRRRRTRMTSATPGASSWRSPRSWPWTRRSSCSTSPRPARTREAWPGSSGSSPSLSEAGRTVIAISHDMRFVAETFERVVVMGSGRILLDGTPAEVFAEPAWPTLASTYLEPPFAARVGARLGIGSTPTEAGLVATLLNRSSGILPT